MKTKTIGVALAAICVAMTSMVQAATVAWKSNAEGYMNVASNWTGAASPEAIYARDAKFNGGQSFSIGPWGCWISKVVQTDK